MPVMRLPSLVALLLCATAAACSFQPNGPNPGDDDDVTDAAVEVDACVPVAETCEGTDQDCDGMIDEGLTTGAPCDGPDADQCLDDMTICDSTGAVVCGDTSGDDDAEVCNGADDDCDGTPDDGFQIGVACDGEDGDECKEGAFACAQDGLAAICTDETSTIVEECNGLDDDCNGAIDNGFDTMTDEENCGECGNECTNGRGTTTCSMGACVPSCTNGAADCDGDPDNGCELQDTNPTCNMGASVGLTVSGDAAQTVMTTGTTESFIRVRIRETQVPDIAITASIQLTSGAGADYDLVVYCTGCGSLPLSDSSDNTIEVGRSDVQNNDRTFDVFVEVRYDGTTPSTTCAPWTLTVTGNVTTANRCGGA